MGRKRKVTRKPTSKSTRSTSRKKTISDDMLGGIIVVIGLMLLVFLQFDNVGQLAEIFKVVSKGIFGYAIYMLPATFIIVGIYMIASDKKIKSKKFINRGLILMILASVCVYSFVGKDFSLFTNFVKYIVNSYNDAVGGIIGATLCGICVKLIGITATRILSVCILFIASLCVFNISFAKLFKYIKIGFEYIIAGIDKVFDILFSEDENDSKKKSTKVNEYSLKNEQIPINNEIEQIPLERKRKNVKLPDFLTSKMKEPRSENTEENLNLDKTEQVEFDFNKLGGKLSEEEIQKKQQRDEFFKKQKEQKEDNSIKEVLTLDHTAHVEVDNYEFPPINLLARPKQGEVFDKRAIHNVAIKLQKTLASFGVEAKVTNITKGPTVTRYELTPSIGVKVSKIVNLSDDIALNLAAKSIRIEAPIPGKAAVGIEVPNEVCESVFLREVIESDAFDDNKSKIAFALGKDAAGDIVMADIAKMPHVLVAGATGSGKSVCINSIIVSLLYRAKPSEVKLILIDPKMVELSGYNGIPHLLIPVVTDPKKAAGALNWAVQEMVNRYSLFASKGTKDIKGYNKIIEKEQGAKLPQIVIIIDELADLMMVAPNDVEDAICRLAQMARAAGMHLVIATQRPSVDVITGIIKANIPSRIAFTVSSQVDSRTILDSAGAEKLLGKGDMLYFPVGETKPLRVQGAFISEGEIEKIVDYIKSNVDVKYNDEIIQSIEKSNIGNGKSKSGKNDDEETSEDDGDVLLNDAINLVVDMGTASASMLQRRFKIGYSRAGRIIDQMEERGLISGYEGSKPRQVLISKTEWQQLQMGNVGDNNSSNEEENTNVSITNAASSTNIIEGQIEEDTVTKHNGIEQFQSLAREEVRRLEKFNRSKYDNEF